METIRKQIIDCLSNGPATALDLSQDLGIMEKEVYEHLPHIGRSMAAQGRNLFIYPSECLKCGFRFEKRKRFTKPGRCPRCKETHIKRPAYENR